MERNDRRLFIVADKLPTDYKKEQGSLNKNSDALNLAVALKEYPDGLKQNFPQLFWAGIPSVSFSTWRENTRKLPDHSYNLLPIFTYKSLYEKYDAGFAQTVIEPLFYATTPDANALENYEQYSQVNQVFCEVLSRQLRPGDTVWIVDHHLLLLPVLLRKTIPELSIGIYLSLPFPSYKVFSLLPEKLQESLLKGLLGADLIAFNNAEAENNFLQCLQMICGLDSEQNVLRFESRLIKVDQLSMSSTMNLAVDDKTNKLTDENNQATLPDTVFYLTQKFLKSLVAIKQKQNNYQVKFLDEYSKRSILDHYRTSKKRLLLLDYDGTLVPFASKPDEAVPGTWLLYLLNELAKKQGTSVFIISGRSSAWLEQHFGTTSINLVAEHGARVKMQGTEWTTEKTAASDWKKIVSQIMQAHADKCAESFVEEKDYSMVWHYRNAAAEAGRKTANALAAELTTHANKQGLQVLSGNKIIEVRKRGLDKGVAIEKILSSEPYDFIFAAGDDKTDEDMFRHLIEKDNCFTVKVGTDASYAHYNLHNPHMILSLLEGFHHLSPAAPQKRN